MAVGRTADLTIGAESMRFRLASVRVALALAIAVGAAICAYALATWSDPGRAILVVVGGTAVATAPVVWRLPWERIIASRVRELFFICWSGVYVVLVTAAAVADGGLESPVAFAFVLPLIFAGLSYQPLSVVAVAVWTLAGVGLAGLLTPAAVQADLLASFTLAAAAVMCVWLAVNRSAQEARLDEGARALLTSEEVSRGRALQQREVADFGQRALAGSSVEELMEDSVRVLRRVLDVDCAGFLELGEDGDLRVRSGAGLPEGILGEAIAPTRDTAAGFTLTSDAPVIVEDWSTERRFTFTPLLRRMEAVSGVNVPIRGRGRPLGLFSIQSQTLRAFGADEVNFMQAMANALANAIERRNEEQDAQHRALHDALTGLPNRILFADRLEHALAEQERRGSLVAVLFLDLDRFKLINDSLGHSAGDELLRAVAVRLGEGLRPGDTVARFGGDEFGILLDDVADERQATEVAERIAAALARPFALHGGEHFATASVGIAIGGPGQEPQGLIRDADAAMYRAKDRGRARYEVFDEEMRFRIAQRLRVETDVRNALARGEFRLHYQPIVSLATGIVYGAEALLRWEHPDRGLLGPRKFLPAAEDAGILVAVGRWVLEEACQQAAAWQRLSEDASPLRISINASVRELADPDFLGTVTRALERSGVEPASLVVELTEGALFEEEGTPRETLEALKSLGVSLAIDDFGTGYSSLSYLKRFPVDAIKLDRSFVEGLGEEAVDRAVVNAVVALARGLDLYVVAEGVETAEQLEIVRELGCHQAQGHHLGEPVPAAEFDALVGQRLTSPRSG